jgi:hypothetical protein
MGEPGDCLSTLHPYSDAGCAVLPLTLLGSPVSIGESRSLGCRQDRDLGSALPGQDRMCPFGIIGVVTRYIPTGALGELAESSLTADSDSALGPSIVSMNTNKKRNKSLLLRGLLPGLLRSSTLDFGVIVFLDCVRPWSIVSISRLRSRAPSLRVVNRIWSQQGAARPGAWDFGVRCFLVTWASGRS